MDLDEVRAGVEARSPYAGEELGAGHDLLGVVNEVEEQRVLARGQVEHLPGERHLATDAVELERADAELREAGRPTDERPDASDELLDLERLHEEVVGAGLEAEDSLAELTARGQHEDRGRQPGLAKLPADGEPVDIGEHPIEHDEVVDPRWRLRQSLRARCARVCREPLLDEHPHEETRELYVVLNDQDLHGPEASIVIRAASYLTEA